MRPFIGGLSAFAVALAIASGSAAAANSEWPPNDKARGTARLPARSVACLGGVLNAGATGSYLTVADYPAFSGQAAGQRRTFICGDSIPSFLPSSERAGFASRRR